MEQSGKTEWYFRVLTEGEMSAGLELRRIERPHPLWTVARANEIMHQRRQDLGAARELTAVEPLSQSWKEALRRRAAARSAE